MVAASRPAARSHDHPHGHAHHSPDLTRSRLRPRSKAPRPSTPLPPAPKQKPVPHRPSNPRGRRRKRSPSPDSEVDELDLDTDDDDELDSLTLARKRDRRSRSLSMIPTALMPPLTLPAPDDSAVRALGLPQSSRPGAGTLSLDRDHLVRMREGHFARPRPRRKTDENRDWNKLTLSEAAWARLEEVGSVPKGRSWTAREGYDEDGEPVKPDLPYVMLTKLVIASSPRKMLTLNQIYQAMEERWPYFRHLGQTFRNSIRHNLSMNPAFVNVERPLHEGGLGTGKGGYWKVSEDTTTSHRGRAKKPRLEDDNHHGAPLDPRRQVPLRPVPCLPHQMPYPPRVQFSDAFSDYESSGRPSAPNSPAQSSISSQRTASPPQPAPSPKRKAIRRPHLDTTSRQLPPTSIELPSRPLHPTHCLSRTMPFSFERGQQDSLSLPNSQLPTPPYDTALEACGPLMHLANAADAKRAEDDRLASPTKLPSLSNLLNTPLSPKSISSGSPYARRL